MKTPVLSEKNIPARLPIFQTLTVWLMIKVFHIVPIAQGAIWAVVALIWIAVIYGWCTQDTVSLDDFERKESK